MARRIREVFLTKDMIDIPIAESDGGTFESFLQERLKTKDGEIIYWQIIQSGNPAGIVTGFVVSSEYRPKGTSMDTRAIKVRPLSIEEQKKYRRQLRKKLKGPLNFW